MKISKLVNILQSGLCRSERMGESQDAKEAEEFHPKNIIAFIAKILLAFYTVISTVCTQYTSRVMEPKPGDKTCDKFINRFHEANELYDRTLNQLNLSVFATSSNDNYTYPQSMQQTDKDKFISIMLVEVAAHEESDHWRMVPRSSLPVGAKTIRSIWSFKRKYFPYGSLNKHKAGICAHGNMQRWGLKYWETFFPVVNMLSVRLLLAIAHIHGLNSKSIYFVLAFPQADIDIDIWSELLEGMIPGGDESNRCLYILKINKSLYGLKQASRNWYE